MRLSLNFVVLLLCSYSLLGQKTESKITWVNGTVLDANRAPVKKAVIYLDSVETKIKTDKKGEFKIGLKPGNELISAYSWKHGIHTVVYDKNKDVLIVFPEIGDVVPQDKLVEMGFKTRKKTRKKKEPKDYSKYLDMYQLIGAEVPGAQVSGTTIRLRGNAINSVNSGQEPLLIVDGTVVGSLEYILPREVASVRVIRDENASIYGARGANGVIVIKMKN